MELIKKNIHMDRIKCKASTQITMEDDINITDSRPDVYQLIEEQGEVVIDEIRAVQDHVYIKGKLEFCVLYLSDDDVRRPASMEGSIPFDEQIYMEGVVPTDSVSVKKDLEDLSVGMINSRKLSVQALIRLGLYVEELYDEEAAVELSSNEPVEFRQKTINLASLAIQKKDIFRIREEMELPNGYPNIFDIFWQTCKLGETQFRLSEGKLSIQGEVQLFFLYEGEGENRPVMWYEAKIPFSGVLDCQDMKIYEEEQTEILSDIYGVTREMEAVAGVGKLKQLLMKNMGKTKISGRFKVAAGLPKMQQLCHSECDIQMAETKIVDEGLRITGAAAVKSLYGTGDPEVPYDSIAGTIPFSYVLEIPGISPECTYKLDSVPEDLSVTMIDADEVEVKAVLDFHGIVFSHYEEPMIQDVKVTDLDPDKLSSLPGIVAYIAREGDSLWNIGKKYYVPVSQIKDINELTSDEIHPGDKLLIVKGIS